MDKIIFPPEGVPSARKAFFRAVESITAPDDYTVVFKLKFPTAAFIPALATPFNFDLREEGPGYARLRVAQSQRQRHGSVQVRQHQPGAFVEGEKNANYHIEGVLTWTASRRSAAPKMAFVCRPSVATGPRSSSVASHRKRVTTLSKRWVIRSRSKRATGTACFLQRRTRSVNRWLTSVCVRL